MADNEAIPKTARAVVVNYEPDYCWTPLGGERVLVAYHIAAFFEDAALEAPTVLYNGMPAHNAGSRLTRCFGDEQGTGGGVKSGVYGGPCKPIGWSSTVNVEGKLAIRHSSDYWMNCDSLSGIGNCRGLAVYLREGQTLQLGADLFWHPNGNPNMDPAALLSLLPVGSNPALLSPEQVQFLGHAIGLVGSVAEATLGGGACVFSPEPLTKVTGCVAFAHGIDSTVPHAYWFAYGGERETFTHQGVAGALEYAGVDPGTADTAAWWTDFGLGFVDVAPSVVKLATRPGSALAGAADEAMEVLDDMAEAPALSAARGLQDDAPTALGMEDVTRGAQGDAPTAAGAPENVTPAAGDGATIAGFDGVTIQGVASPAKALVLRFLQHAQLSGDDAFKALVLDDLEKIASTPRGQQMLETILDSNKPIEIHAPVPGSPYYDDYLSKSAIHMVLDLDDAHVQTIPFTGAERNAGVFFDARPGGAVDPNAVVIVKRGWSTIAGPGPGSGSVIAYSPLDWPRAGNPGTPSYIVLGHELGHAESAATGTYAGKLMYGEQLAEDGVWLVDRFPDPEEARVVIVIENGLREFYKLPIRPDYWTLP